MNQPPKNKDIAILACFIALITLQPFFLHHEIIMMETGIHLPALNALFRGEVPYRDFFFLRGPLDLYVPAVLMFFLGKTSAALPLFYYLWTIATLLILLLIAKQFIRTRFILYLFIPVLVARTFPRVSYYYWGGMRYALGLLTVFFAVMFFKKQRPLWIYFAGVVAALSLLTTLEAGFCSFAAVVGALLFALIFKIYDGKRFLKSLGYFCLGAFAVLLPYVIYLAATRSLIPLVDSNFTVVTKLMDTFRYEKGFYPATPLEFLFSLFPLHKFFKITTPVYCYAALGAYLFWRLKRKKGDGGILSLVCLAAYGMILYFASFRMIQGHHFEMALQPEKILLFFLAEEFYFFLKNSKFKKIKLKLLKKPLTVNILGFFVIALIGSSLGYSIARYNHRFPVFKMAKNAFVGKQEDLSLLAGEEKRPLRIERGKGMIVPSWQADEIEKITDFLKVNTRPDEKIFSFPEVGNFSFWADRPFVGRFPIATFSWMDERWARELFRDLKAAKPKYVIMTHVGHRTFPAEWYFRNPKNIIHFKEVTDYILAHYNLKESFSSVGLYQLK